MRGSPVGRPGCSDVLACRQWIQQNSDASTGLVTFKDYVTEWWFARPSARLGLNPTYVSLAKPGYPLWPG